MSNITLRVIEGADRGRTYEELTTPVTIGREEGNSIQLNDERISRFHVKIQDDHDRFVLTDLESTNGTKVNGEDIQLRILRFGDMITIGRSVLLFGSRNQIAERLAHLRGGKGEVERHGGTICPSDVGPAPSLDELEREFGLSNLSASGQATLHSLLPPELPERLSPGQAAQLSEILEYLHIRIRSLLDSVKSDDRDGRVTLDFHRWQNLLDLQARLAEYLRKIGEPDVL